MHVLAVASEMHPFVKTGGLADVVGALPAALAPYDVHVTTVLPGYPAVLAAVGDAEVVAHYPDLFGGPARLLRTSVGATRLLVVDAPLHFGRDGGIYSAAGGREWDDNWRRFAALSAAAASVAAGVVAGYRPDIVHAHDWQAALTLAYLRHGPRPQMPAVMTIHNLAFQGGIEASLFPQLGLPARAFAIDGVEYYGGVGYLKAGLYYADAITTVSPAYADEILTPSHGMGLDGLLAARRGRLHGILNGIDTAEWNPATDPAVPVHYGAHDLAARAGNRERVEQRFGIAPGDGPLFAVVSRLTWQKGLDILAGLTDELVAMGGRLAVLGSGDRAIEAAMVDAAARHPGKIGISTAFDEPLSHLVQAGADAILIPSRFEPCGLTQLYALRYGCVPVVAHTGGLGDTVIDANQAAVAAGVATGVVHDPGSAEALRSAIHRTVALHAQRDVWESMQRAGMEADFSWRQSAARYAELYKSLLQERTPA
jgi:starch synthase